jgi:hypothetical protein
MPKSKPHEIHDVQAADPENATYKLDEFTRRIMAVPKKEIDAAMEKERKGKKRRR